MRRLVPKQLACLVTSLFILVALLVISSGCAAFNQTPIIDSLTANEELVDPSGTAHLSVVARDLDRDELTYTWTASGGTISGEGTEVTWTAPKAPGAYTITVTVTDGKGGEVTSEVYVDVISEVNNPPYVRNITYDETDCPLGFFHDDVTYSFTCDAFDIDGDELTYTWEAEGGTISGEGATIDWKVGVHEYGDYYISAYATDSKGAQSRKKFISVKVHCPCEDPVE